MVRLEGEMTTGERRLLMSNLVEKILTIVCHQRKMRYGLGDLRELVILLHGSQIMITTRKYDHKIFLYVGQINLF